MGKGHNKRKRRGNLMLQARRARSWARGKNASEKRAAANLARHRENMKNLAGGIPTPWQAAKGARQRRRAAKAADFKKRQNDTILGASLWRKMKEPGAAGSRGSHY